MVSSYTVLYSLDDGANVQEVLTEISNQKTVPNIFVNKVHVGGCDRTFQVMIVITHRSDTVHIVI